MRIETTLQPGAPGTKRLVDRFGERYVCVRYRLDTSTGRRYKTVELIVDERRWKPRRLPNEVVWLRVAYQEKDLQRRLREAGARWHKRRKVWSLRYRDVVALLLTSRIVDDSSCMRIFLQPVCASSYK